MMLLNGISKKWIPLLKANQVYTRALQNREKLFSDIVRDNHASIYRICVAYLYDKSHVQDLYQEILLQVWHSLDKYKGEARLSTWIYRIAVNTAITYNIQNKKQQLDPLPDSVHTFHDEPGQAHEKEQQLAMLTSAIRQLEEQDRLIISLVLEDLSYKDIADIIGSNTNNVGVRITRIKTRLLKLMENNSGHDEL